MECETRQGKINATSGAGPFLMAILRGGGIEISDIDDDSHDARIQAPQDNKGVPWSEPFVHPLGKGKTGLDLFRTEELPSPRMGSWFFRLFRKD